jgi:UDP-N-acetylglucosamine 2-epimerase (non-hydrolysing)
VGARPNFVKLAPLLSAAYAAGQEMAWVHTAQHEDVQLTKALWRDLVLPEPDAVVRHEKPGARRAERMAARLLEPLAEIRPSLVVVVGDVDSTVAGALAARRLGVPVAHVEAGLRSGDRRMPEERNRVRVDRLSHWLHVPEPSGVRHLVTEGFAGARVHLAGNVTADALKAVGGGAKAVRPRPYAWKTYGVVTLHRPVNVDAPARFARYLDALVEVAEGLPLVFPAHPRTAKHLKVGVRRKLSRADVHVSRPLGYLEFLGLVEASALVITDSGGLPVEASLLEVPCVTARSRYEHELTLTHGTNRLAGSDPRRLAAVAREALDAPRAPRARPPEWDGNAATRIVSRWKRRPGSVV